MEAAGAQRPEFRPEQEVRFAVVMYGGVSLAIYINGVAQELFRLVRATAPEAPFSDEEHQRVYFPSRGTHFKRSAIKSSERVYRTLGQILNLTGPPDAPDDTTAGKPVRTRFVIDIISGTSAGGINGVFLATAIANQQEFEISGRLWREVADIDALLLEERPSPPTPQSLLDGDRLYREAREAMREMARKEEDPGDKFAPSYADQLDLAVTATDLGGLPMPIRLSGDKTVHERGHRAVFRFSYGSEGATGEEHSDFTDSDLLLGFAARATSSFPAAFEPVRLDDLRQLGYDRAQDADAEVTRFFPEHVHAELDPELVVFADGGYLDNKPFSYATEALRRRRADVPVRRKLVYIEPHPVAEDRADLIDRPDVFGSVGASMTLPTRETIREDIAAVAARNFAVERIRELGLNAERTLGAGDPPESAGAPYAAYRTLRVRTVLDALARTGARLLDATPDGDVARQARQRLREWIEARPAGHDAALDDYDVAFEQRRLSFLHDRINDLLRGEARAARMVAAANVLGIDGAPPTENAQEVLDAATDPPLADAARADLLEQADALRALKRALNDAIRLLRRAERAPYANDPAKTLDPDKDDPEKRDPEPYERFLAVQAAAGDLATSAGEYMEALERFLEKPLEAARTGLGKALATPPAGLAPWIAELLRVYDRRFEAFDMLVLPLAYPDLGEVNAVDVLRISPLDAEEIAPRAAAGDVTAKLAGIRMRHFGGFLARAWRENDLLWGRLDGAEAIIHALVESDDLRTTLRVQAHAAILREELEGDSDFVTSLRERVVQELGTSLAEAGDDGALVEAFKRAYTLAQPLKDEDAWKLADRSVGIAARVLGDGAQSRKLPKPLVGAIRRMLPALVKTGMKAARLRSRLPELRLGWPPIRRRRADG